MFFKKHNLKTLLLLLIFVWVYFVLSYNVLPKVYKIKKEVVESQTIHDLPSVDYAFNAGNKKLVMYNRVSKCASSTMIWIARYISKTNAFVVNVSDTPRMANIFNESEKKAYVSELSSLPSNTLFIRHYFYIDFNEFGTSAPAYINVIRDPVDRFISRFYYSRYGFIVPKKKRNNILTRRNWTLDECVLSGVETCLKMENYRSIMSFFCDGDFEKCLELTPSTLQRSMDNVVNHYAVVGLQEDLPNTLAMLEVVLPTYFKGSSKILIDSPETNRTKSLNRNEPSDEIKSILRRGLHLEVEFYEFVRKRFYDQLNKLKLLKLIRS